MKTSFDILDEINNVQDLKKLSKEELPILAEEIRQKIIKTVSENGGHLASSLGATDLAVAIHYVFNAPEDKIIWDVGHQSYAHKILTGRKDVFEKIRTFKGISGFPKISESEYDAFGTGHASTSISAALGFAAARDLQKKDYKIVSIIGDGSLTGGLAFEGLQNSGHLKKNMLIVLNDNEMFISKRVGAVAEYFAKFLTAGIAQKTENKIMETINKFPSLNTPFEKLIRRVKTMFSPGMLFEEMGIAYIGPVQGHNIENLTAILEKIKNMKGPVILHTITKKGKGYKPAEEEPSKFHGVGKFCVETGVLQKPKGISYTKIFSDALIKLAEQDEKITAVTAAMPDGTGLCEFAKKFPKRFFDVGIAEEHAVTFAAGLCAAGLRPVCAIYSTFMQRALDNIIHDVCLQELPVIFALDRAGFVGEDGATHHGVFDFSYLNFIPNLIIMSPSNENELQDMLTTAVSSDKPCAIRYPKGTITGIAVEQEFKILEIGKAKILKDGNEVYFLAIGNQVKSCLKAAEILKEKNINAGVVDMRFLKPIDEKLLQKLSEKIKCFVTVEENSIIGGLGNIVKSILCNTNSIVESIAIPDKFTEHGKTEFLRELYGFTPEKIAAKILNML